MVCEFTNGMTQTEKHRVRNWYAENLEKKKLTITVAKKETMRQGDAQERTVKKTKGCISNRGQSVISVTEMQGKKDREKALDMIKVGDGSDRFSVLHFYFVSKANQGPFMYTVRYLLLGKKPSR